MDNVINRLDVVVEDVDLEVREDDHDYTSERLFHTKASLVAAIEDLKGKFFSRAVSLMWEMQDAEEYNEGGKESEGYQESYCAYKNVLELARELGVSINTIDARETMQTLRESA